MLRFKMKYHYLDIGHSNFYGGTCWYFKDKLLVKEKTGHSEWLDSGYFSVEDYAFGRYDDKKKLISFVGYSMSESRKEYVKKLLLQKFDGKIIEC